MESLVVFLTLICTGLSKYDGVVKCCRKGKYQMMNFKDSPPHFSDEVLSSSYQCIPNNSSTLPVLSYNSAKVSFDELSRQGLLRQDYTPDCGEKKPDEVFVDAQVYL